LAALDQTTRSGVARALPLAPRRAGCCGAPGHHAFPLPDLARFTGWHSRNL
jgi:hypothetical protein